MSMQPLREWFSSWFYKNMAESRIYCWVKTAGCKTANMIWSLQTPFGRIVKQHDKEISPCHFCRWFAHRHSKQGQSVPAAIRTGGCSRSAPTLWSSSCITRRPFHQYSVRWLQAFLFKQVHLQQLSKTQPLFLSIGMCVLGCVSVCLYECRKVPPSTNSIFFWWWDFRYYLFFCFRPVCTVWIPYKDSVFLFQLEVRVPFLWKQRQWLRDGLNSVSVQESYWPPRSISWSLQTRRLRTICLVWLSLSSTPDHWQRIGWWRKVRTGICADHLLPIYLVQENLPSRNPRSDSLSRKLPYLYLDTSKYIFYSPCPLFGFSVQSLSRVWLLRPQGL